MMTNTKKYVPWPEDDKPLDFEALVDPVVEAIRFAYKMERQNAGKNVPWNGPNFGKDCAATCLPPHEKLRASRLKYSEEDQGRDPLVEIISLAFQLGIEQGRRITMTGNVIGLMKIQAKMGDILMKDALAAKEAKDA